MRNKGKRQSQPLGNDMPRGTPHSSIDKESSANFPGPADRRSNQALRAALVDLY